MTSKFARIVMTMALTASMAALAQTGSAAAAAPASVPAVSGATKIGTIAIEQAIFATNEGQRDLEALSKKLEPKQNDLKSMNDDLESLKKQLSTQGDKMNDEARASLTKQIEQKQRSFERAVQDAQEDLRSQQGDIAQRVLQKMAPMLVKYAGDNGFSMILDTSKPWPDSPVLWYNGASTDITKQIVDAYNAQSGVPAPAPKPAAARPAGAAAKPATPPAPKPQTQAPPK